MIRLPMDNLYKFMTVLGLILTLNFGYYIYKYWIVLEENMFQAEMLVKKNMYIDSPSYLGKLKTLKQLEESASDQDEKQKIKELFNDILQNKREKSLDVDKLLERVNQQIQDSFILWFYKFVTVPVFCIGIVMMGYGFVKWYRHVQKYQDIILKNSAMKSNGSKKARPRKVLKRFAKK